MKTQVCFDIDIDQIDDLILNVDNALSYCARDTGLPRDNHYVRTRALFADVIALAMSDAKRRAFVRYAETYASADIPVLHSILNLKQDREYKRAYQATVDEPNQTMVVFPDRSGTGEAWWAVLPGGRLVAELAREHGEEVIVAYDEEMDCYLRNLPRNGQSYFDVIDDQLVLVFGDES